MFNLRARKKYTVNKRLDIIAVMWPQQGLIRSAKIHVSYV